MLIVRVKLHNSKISEFPSVVTVPTFITSTDVLLCIVAREGHLDVLSINIQLKKLFGKNLN